MIVHTRFIFRLSSSCRTRPSEVRQVVSASCTFFGLQHSRARLLDVPFSRSYGKWDVCLSLCHFVPSCFLLMCSFKMSALVLAIMFLAIIFFLTFLLSVALVFSFLSLCDHATSIGTASSGCLSQQFVKSHLVVSVMLS